MIRVDAANSVLTWQGLRIPCALGKGGVLPEAMKREGDGATPLGRYPLRWVYYRPDRVAPPVTGLCVEPLTQEHGWCDAAGDANYNRPVSHPYPASAEHLWRDDGLYDVIVVLGHNDDPVQPGFGSAIFLHCCKYDDAGVMKPTLGCVAVPRDDLIAMLRTCAAGTQIEIS
jgi:L,D-peptidoglycan transpeptidase YkuD (ErfK/YbiS/YcfS/YnhG family)